MKNTTLSTLSILACLCGSAHASFVITQVGTQTVFEVVDPIVHTPSQNISSGPNRSIRVSLTVPDGYATGPTMQDSNASSVGINVGSANTPSGSFEFVRYDAGVTFPVTLPGSVTFETENFVFQTDGDIIIPQQTIITEGFSFLNNGMTDTTNLGFAAIDSSPGGTTVTQLGGTTTQITTVPEPSSALLLGLGALAMIRRKR